MRAGTLHHRVTIQRLNSSSDPRWGDTRTWGDTATVSAEVLPLGGDESGSADGVATVQRYRVRIRYSPALADLSSADRLIFSGRELDIIGVVNTDNRNRELVIEAVQHGA